MKYALKPLTLGELLDRTFSFYRGNFVLFAGIAALPALSTLILGSAMSFFSPQGGAGVVASLALMFLIFVISTFTQGATVVAVSRIQLGQPTNSMEAFATIRPRLGELVALALNVGVRVGLGILLLIIPGIMIAVRYALAIPAALLEDRTVSEALPRSSDLTQGHRWRIFLIFCLFFALMIVFSMVWQVPVTLLGGTPRGEQPQTWVLVAMQVGNFLTTALVGPVMTIALAVVYYDQRVRKEAFDLEHMMQQLDRLSPELAQPTT